MEQNTCLFENKNIYKSGGSKNTSSKYDNNKLVHCYSDR